jgi:tripartite-type tricarboxylate transporter receptor subunit TctC
VRGDRSRLRAVSGNARDPAFPEVPTFRELGYDLVAKPWYAMFAPAGTPPAVVTQLSKALTDAVADPAIHARLVEMGLEPTGHGADRLGEILQADLERWGPVIRASGFKPGQ